MRTFKRELIIYIGLILFLLIFGFAFLGCSEDRMEIECNCQSVETTIRVVTQNGLPRIISNKSYSYYSSDCRDDGKQLTKNIIVKCN